MRYLLLLLGLGVALPIAAAIAPSEERYLRYHERADDHRETVRLRDEDEFYEPLVLDYERRQRLTALQLHEMEMAETRDHQLSLREDRLLRGRARDARARRVAALEKSTMRQRQVQRLTERSWHDLPHSNVSSPVKREHLPPYSRSGLFRDQVYYDY